MTPGFFSNFEKQNSTEKYMAANLEIKIPLKNFNAIVRHLDALNARFEATLHQTDVYFSTPSGLLKLRIENGSSQLIHYHRNETGKNRKSTFYILGLTGDDPLQYFRRLFPVETIVKKKRLLYLYGDTRIHLDSVQKLGKFLELESRILHGFPKAKKEFQYVVDGLQLDVSLQFRGSYRDMLMNPGRT